MTNDRSKTDPPRSRWRWRAALLGGLAAVLAYLRCGNELGLGGGSGDSVGQRQEAPVTPPPVDAGALRCQLRLDGGGLWLLGSTGQALVEVPGAVESCKAAGGADVVITGEARQGAWEELRAALEAAGVPSFVRGAAGGGGPS
ncbi:MAG: hypothetical protein R3B48_13325 [Kofleriaceae bacterium]